MSLREEFIRQGIKEGANISDLCRRYQISRKTGYKWLKRYERGNATSLKDNSRRPLTTPRNTAEDMIKRIIEVREHHPKWGARKIRAVLIRKEVVDVPAVSTIHRILQLKGYIGESVQTRRSFIRFEHEAPNHLWQMDFKGNFEYEKGRCYPLTVLDDHSRFALVLKACRDEKGSSVKPVLIEAFERYGLPYRINVDNGNPWGSLFECARYTLFSLWLIRQGIIVSYSRPYHPQTNGKDERFHRTLKEELLSTHYFKDLAHIQMKLDAWRDIYNTERPHEGIGMQVPLDRYYPSYRVYRKELPEIVYREEAVVKKVDSRGRITYAGRQIYVGMPFSHEPIALEATSQAEVLEVYYCHQKLGEIDLNVMQKNTLTNLYSGKVSHL